jgi:hypothetical protein
MRLFEIEQYVPNPFPASKIKQPMYHGSSVKGIKKFRRPRQGLWFAETESWAAEHYSTPGGEIYVCWLNVKNPYTPTEDEIDQYYGATYGSPEEVEAISKFFDQLRANGYDAYIQGGESGSTAIFESVEIVNAKTGNRM